MDAMDIGGKGIMVLAGDVLRLSWSPGVAVEVNDDIAVLSAMATLSKGRRLPMLIDLHEVTYSVEARKIFPAASSVSRIALLGSSPVDEAVATFFAGRKPLPYPIRYFTSCPEALAWLREGPQLTQD